MRLFGLYLVVKGVIAGVAGWISTSSIRNIDLGISLIPASSYILLFIPIILGVLLWLVAKPVAALVTDDLDPE